MSSVARISVIRSARAIEREIRPAWRAMSRSGRCVFFV
jgi:hypothetical protein